MIEDIMLHKMKQKSVDKKSRDFIDKQNTNVTEEDRFKKLSFKEIKALDTIEIDKDIDELLYPPKEYVVQPVLDNFVLKYSINTEHDPKIVQYLHVNYSENYLGFYVYYRTTFDFIPAFFIDLSSSKLIYGIEQDIDIVDIDERFLENAESFCTSIIKMGYSILASISYIIENRETEYILKECATVPSAKSSTLKAEKRIYSILNQSNKLYTYTTRTDRDKRAYNRNLNSWVVTGHLRHYKSGKTVWIPPYVKGDGVRKPKKFKIK